MPANVSNRTSRSLVYGLDLLRLFTIEQPVRGIAELAEQMSVSRPTAHRYASTCLELGYLEQAPMRRYRLARRSAAPGMAMIDSLRITQRARPIVRKLREETGRTVSHAVLEGTDVLYLQRLCGYEQGQYELEKGLGDGSRLPSQATAAGLALVTPGDIQGPTQRPPSTRLVIHDREPHHDARGIAVAVRAHKREQLSALEITVPADAMSGAELTAEFGELLQTAAGMLQGTPLDGSAVSTS